MRGFLARAVVRYRLAVILFWMIVAAVAVPQASRVSDSLRVEGESVNQTEARQAELVTLQSFSQPFARFFAVTISGSMAVDSAPYHAFIDSLAATAGREAYIERVITVFTSGDSSLVSRDRRATFFIAAVRRSLTDSATSYVPGFRLRMHAAAAALAPASQFDVKVTGASALDYDVRTISNEDAAIGERKAIPLMLAWLVLAFGALVAATLPMVVGVFAITCSFALVHVVARVHPMSVFVLNIISMVGLGVGVDYSLLMVTRFREEMNHGFGRLEAAVRAVMTAGVAVITSGATVVVGFAALFLTPLTETRSVAIGGLFVVAIAVLLSVTLLPATLAILGRAIDHPRWLAKRLSWYHAPRAWERWARWLAYHPYRAVIIGMTIVAVITWPLSGIRIGLPRSGWFPAQTESAAGVKVLEQIGAAGALQPVDIVIQVPEGQRALGSRYLRGLRRLSDSLSADPRVAQVRGPVDLQPHMSLLQYSILYSDLARARERYPDFTGAYVSQDGRTVRMNVLFADTTSFPTSMDAIRHIREVIRRGVPGLESAKILVGGFAASSVDLQSDLLSRFPVLIASVLIVTAIMLFVAFQSILVPIKAVVMNCLSVAGAFGLIVLVFQHGVGAKLFGLDGPTETVYVVVPVLVFAVVFGLSMDYEVFLLSRIKEAFDRTGRNRQATMEGLSATASTITSAAAIMIIVFGTFSFARVLAVQLIGFGLAVAVFLDATLIRMVLVPAIMHIAGDWNWWPRVSPAKRADPQN
jgi:RND superfamily putative drug exporter